MVTEALTTALPEQSSLLEGESSYMSKIWNWSQEGKIAKHTGLESFLMEMEDDQLHSINGVMTKRYVLSFV